jgi:hypothetical protein
MEPESSLYRVQKSPQLGPVLNESNPDFVTVFL